MANLAASGVTINKSFPIADRTGKLVGKVMDLTLVLSTMGSATNKITAAVLGFTEIWAVRSARRDGNTHISVLPSYDGTELYVFAMENATDATRVNPVDISDTIRVIVEGRE